jgi:amino acid adenylation domain-containing protein
MIVDRFLSDSAKRTPDAIAVIELNRSISYGELDRLANRFANMFASHGVRRGDRVVIAGDNSIDFIAAYFGAMRAGAVSVPLPAGPRNDRFAKALADCQPVACVVDTSLMADPVCGQALTSVRSVFVYPHRGAWRNQAMPPGGIELGTALQAADDAPPAVRLIDLDLAAIIYTSGSTGEPRGVMLTHRNIATNTRSIVQYLRLTAADRVMCVLPFYYVYGLSLLHTHVYAGGSLVIENRFAYPSVVLRGMREHRVTGFAGVPSTFTLLMTRPELTGEDLSSLRYVTQAGGAMPASKISQWRERVPHVPFYVMYGATEASARLTYLDPSALERKLGSIGRAIPNVDIRVFREDGRPAETGETGELVARGSNISCGYWNDASGTNERFSPMGYRTGDLGYVDDEGYIFLVGRRHDMIKTGAHRVGPKEIEDVICQHPEVQEAAVVGEPHEILGEAPVAFVVPVEAAKLDTESLRAFCHQHMASYKIPVRFVVVEQLPRIPGIGKIDRGMLRSRLAESPRTGRTA